MAPEGAGLGTGKAGPRIPRFAGAGMAGDDLLGILKPTLGGIGGTQLLACASLLVNPKILHKKFVHMPRYGRHHVICVTAMRTR